MVTNRENGNNGFALLIVLWSVIFLSLLMSGILAAGRSSMDLAANLRAAAVQTAAADGAINTAVFHSLAPPIWSPDGKPHTVRVGGITVVVRITSEAGKINPNLASPTLLTGLLRATGLPATPSATLADAITAWRETPVSPSAGAAAINAYRAAGMPYAPAGQQFADISELADVLGMTPAILKHVEPYLSIYQTGDPNPIYAASPVVAALKYSHITHPDGLIYQGAPVIRVSACAETRCRFAIFEVPGAASLNPFTILAVGDGQ